MPDAVIQLLQTLEKNRNIKFTGPQLAVYKERVLLWLQSHQVKNIEAFSERLARDEATVNQLIEWLTVKSSFFFRNCLVFDMIFLEVFPDILNRARMNGSDSIRIWSAGCSTGEEPYSLAILINEFYQRSGMSLPTYLFGTDISEKALRQAKRGRYIKKKLQDTKLRLVEAYFSIDGNHYQISDTIRDMVDFSVHDMLSETSFAPTASVFGSFDLVLCRNVLIYYPTKQQEQITRRLLQSTRKGGYLILGETEALTDTGLTNMKIIDPRAKIYRKQV